MGKSGGPVAGVLLATLLLGCVSDAAPPPAPIVDRQQGVSWVAAHQPVSDADFERPVADGVTWIAQNPFGWQRQLDTPEIVLATGNHVMWGESDEGLAATARLAQARGLKTLLRPHLWLTDAPDGKWLGDVAMASETDWTRWFESYRRFILHYAELAQAERIELLSVGAELSTTTAREADWRRVIAEVRRVYSGKLTYAANWHREFEQIRFWDALDFIGIQAYFPLGDQERPSLEELAAAWRPHVAAIERVQRRFAKPVLFTEIGYRSAAGAAARPWEWPARSREPAAEAELAFQADLYEAFFRTFWDRPWFAGAYFWKWFPGLERAARPPGREFSPQNKPAENVLARWYGR